MIRTVYQNGKFIPIEPVPAQFVEGSTYSINDPDVDSPMSPEQIDLIFADVNLLAQQMTDKDERVIDSAIQKIRHQDRASIKPPPRID